MVNQKEGKEDLSPENKTVRLLHKDYESIVSVIDKNIRTIQWSIYSVALVGFVIAVRSVRPFKKFTNPNEIPKRFFKKHVELNGNVMRIDFFPKPVLMVDHNPVLFSGFRKPGKGLKVSIEGIDLMPNGVSWLQTIIVGQQIKFTLVAPQKEYVTSIVEFNKKDVGNQLVTLGFASVSTFNQDLDSDKLYAKYYKNLLKKESKAEASRLGMWSDAPVNVFKFIFSKLFYSLKPKSLKPN